MAANGDIGDSSSPKQPAEETDNLLNSKDSAKEENNVKFNLNNGNTRSFQVIGIPEESISDKSSGQQKSMSENAGSSARKTGAGIPLWEDEYTPRPLVSSILSDLINYDANVQPAAKDTHDDIEIKKSAKPQKPQLGTMVGVYLPTIQNIFGVLLFLRLSWIVGTAGIFHSFCIVGLCCCCTLLTAISMSAIATNGYVPAGGSYFMISRALGPECGGAVGVLFFIGTSFAASMYINGAVEILLTYIYPGVSLFGELEQTTGEVSEAMLNNMRVYGTIFLVSMATLVFVGVKYVNKLAGLFLACVLVSILCIYIGIFSVGDKASICTIDGASAQQDVLISLPSNYSCVLSVNDSRPNVFDLFCLTPREMSLADCLLEYPYLSGNVGWQFGIQGITSGLVADNLYPFYRDKGEVLPGKQGIEGSGALTSDILTSAMILTGIFFPSCTGIMAGSNRSGDLKNAAKSIPVGTIAAILTTSLVYLSAVVLFGAVATPSMLRDKFGATVAGSLFCSQIAFPTKWIVVFGAFFSTIGAGLQSLTGAPRLLQAIARDDILPPLKYFAKGKKNGEPSWALLLSAGICEIGILIASIDKVAPIITIFFLMCYMFVNVACALQTLLKSPNWRPTFRFYHWGLSLLGMVVCLFIMFISNWYQAIMALVIAGCIYKYIEYAGAKKEWGDGIRGLSLSAALYGLRKLEEAEPHTKNWRPQILALVPNSDMEFPAGQEQQDEDNLPEANFPYSLISQLKAGKGLTIVGSAVQGHVNKSIYQRKEELADTLRAQMTKHKVKGFVQCTISETFTSGYLNLMQVSGLGGLKPNTVMIQWPKTILNKEEKGFSLEARLFMNVLEAASAGKQVIMALKNTEAFPGNKQIQEAGGAIDIWWVVHDGGILMLLGFLLQKHKVWRMTKMRIFTVAQPEDNSIKIRDDLVQFLKLVRIQAQVFVIELPSDDISAYTYEKTLMMEQRNQILQNLHMSRKESRREVQLFAEMTRASGAHKISTPFGPASPTIPEGATPATTGGRAELSFEVGVPSPVIEVTVPLNEEGEPMDPPEKASDSSDGAAEVPVSPSAADLDNPRCLANVDPVVTPTAESKPAHLATGRPGATLSKPDEHNVKMMDAATKLNSLIVEKSKQAKLLFINLPAAPPRNPQKFYYYLHFAEALTKDVTCPTVLVRGSGREFVTIYS